MKRKKRKKKKKEEKKKRKTKEKRKIFFSLPSKTVGCFSGRLMSAASDQKMFCKLCSPFCCSFGEFVEEKVISPSYSSAILTPPPSFCFLRQSILFFSIVSVPIYISNNSTQEFPFLHVLANSFFYCLLILDIITCVRCYLIVILIHISLMICDAEHLFMYQFLFVCLLYKNVYSDLLPILMIFFLLLSCMSSLYILDINALSDIWFANNLSHSLSYLFILLIISFAVQTF